MSQNTKSYLLRRRGPNLFLAAWPCLSGYRCGDLIDLCRGPHLPNTNRAKVVAGKSGRYARLQRTSREGILTWMRKWQKNSNNKPWLGSRFSEPFFDLVSIVRWFRPCQAFLVTKNSAAYWCVTWYTGLPRFSQHAALLRAPVNEAQQPDLKLFTRLVTNSTSPMKRSLHAAHN